MSKINTPIQIQTTVYSLSHTMGLINEAYAEQLLSKTILNYFIQISYIKCISLMFPKWGSVSKTGRVLVWRGKTGANRMCVIEITEMISFVSLHGLGFFKVGNPKWVKSNLFPLVL